MKKERCSASLNLILGATGKTAEGVLQWVSEELKAQIAEEVGIEYGGSGDDGGDGDDDDSDFDDDDDE